MNEKRRTVRLSVDIPVKIRHNGITTPGKSLNLSCGGINIQSPKTLPDKEACELTLSLPDGRDPLVLRSEVVWQKPNIDEWTPESDLQEVVDDSGDDPGDETSAGLQFAGLDAEQKQRLQEFITRTIRQNVH